MVNYRVINKIDTIPNHIRYEKDLYHVIDIISKCSKDDYDISTAVYDCINSGTDYYLIYTEDFLQPIGVVGVSKSKFDWSVFEIHDCYILEKYRRNGLFTEMFGIIEKEIKEKYNAVTCILSSDNPLFKKLGFELIATTNINRSILIKHL